MGKLVVVFDLDDTLYKEIDFLKSAYKEIACFLSQKTHRAYELLLSEMMGYYHEGLNVFETIIDAYDIKDVSTEDLIKMYRNHKPQILLESDIDRLLIKLKKEVFKLGLVTDGRGVQQRNKIKALGLTDYFDDVIISEEFGSEKPHVNNFKYFEQKYGATRSYVYVGDNTKKDFIAPNNLGWTSICLLDDGHNIHKQLFELDVHIKPKYIINELVELELLLKQVKYCI